MFRNLILVLIIAGAAMAVPMLYREHPQAFEAAALDDDALIGMSFLKRLRHYSVEDGTLVLEQ